MEERVEHPVDDCLGHPGAGVADRSRTFAGRAAARARGRVGDRPPTLIQAKRWPARAMSVQTDVRQRVAKPAPHAGVLTDGVKWPLFHVDGDELRLVSRSSFTVSPGAAGRGAKGVAHTVFPATATRLLPELRESARIGAVSTAHGSMPRNCARSSPTARPVWGAREAEALGQSDRGHRNHQHPRRYPTSRGSAHPLSVGQLDTLHASTGASCTVSATERTRWVTPQNRFGVMIDRSCGRSAWWPLFSSDRVRDGFCFRADVGS